MASTKVPLLSAGGAASGHVALADAVFGAELRPHLIHETVRAEQAAARRGTQATKSRGLVSGGRSKPWRQKGTGRARAGTTRAAQWTGGGVAFALRGRSYDLKVNRKARKAALRGVLAAHASRGSLAVLAADAFGEPSTKAAAALLSAWGGERPLVVFAEPGETNVIKSFRNIEHVLVLSPSEIEVGALVWARSLLATQRALERVQEVAS